jgi:hypothetical protein
MRARGLAHFRLRLDGAVKRRTRGAQRFADSLVGLAVQDEHGVAGEVRQRGDMAGLRRVLCESGERSDVRPFAVGRVHAVRERGLQRALRAVVRAARDESRAADVVGERDVHLLRHVRAGRKARHRGVRGVELELGQRRVVRICGKGKRHAQREEGKSQRRGGHGVLRFRYWRVQKL